nr:hypothetical protein [Blastomonas natatoria]
MKTLCHGREGKPVACAGIEERSAAGKVADQMQMPLFGIPDGKSEIAVEPIDAARAPGPPRGNDQRRLGHVLQSLGRDGQLCCQIGAVVDPRIRHEVEATRFVRQWLAIEAIFRHQAHELAGNGNGAIVAFPSGSPVAAVYRKGRLHCRYILGGVRMTPLKP